MKKIFVSLAALFMTVCVSGCSNEGGSTSQIEYSEVSDQGEHVFSEDYACDETYHWHVALCEHSDLIFGKEEHNFSKWKTVRAASAKMNGLDERECKVCGYKEQREREKLPLVWITESIIPIGTTLNYVVKLVNEATKIETGEDIYFYDRDGEVHRKTIHQIQQSTQGDGGTIRTVVDEFSYEDQFQDGFTGVVMTLNFDSTEERDSFKSLYANGLSYFSTVGTLYQYEMTDEGSEWMIATFEFLAAEYGGGRSTPINGTYTPQGYNEFGYGDVRLIIDTNGETINRGDTKTVKVRFYYRTYVCPYLTYTIKEAGKLTALLTITDIPTYVEEAE